MGTDSADIADQGRLAASGHPYMECTHCGLPVPAGLVEPGAAAQFCCAGCRAVFSVIHEHGLDRYYDLRRSTEEDRRAAKRTDRTYAEFDDPAFADLYCRTTPAGTTTTELYLEGVHCAACAWLVERVPRLVPGAVEVRLDVGRARASVTWDPAATPLSAIARTLDTLGYVAHPFRGVRADEIARRQDRAMLVRIGVTGAAAGNTMAIAFALYGGLLHGMEPEYLALFRWTSLAISVPAILWGGSVFFRGAWAALRTRTLHMDLPISLGIVIAFASGAVNTFRGTGSVYFESLTALIFLLLVGRHLQGRQQRSAADAAELLYALAPSSARKIGDDGAVREVPIEALAPGERVEVRAGDTVPADGRVVRGASVFDTSLLTGETRPVPVHEGDRVHAGTVNVGSPLVVEVERTGEETRVGRLMRLVEEHARRRAPIVQLADRMSGRFVVGVLASAAATAAIWLPRDAEAAVEHVVALLIVTCPCALGLATPLAVAAAVGQAARAGLLVKGADVLERLAGSGHVWLDKTGTLTEGKLALDRWWGDPAARRLAAAVERGSAHVLARALADVDGSPGADGVRETLGGGVEGVVEGHAVLVGSPAFAARRGAVLPADAAREIEGILDDGLTPVVVAVDGRVVALAAFGDPVRPEAPDAVARLRAAGWTPGILSGDHPRVVAAVGRRLGIDPLLCRGGVTPEEKLATVTAGVAAGPVVMVGDGVNDAAALSAATVGIGVHGGAEASLAAADVFASHGGLRPLVELFDGARRTMHVVRRNLVVSLGYNVAGVGLAMAGLIDPLVAAVLMPASSLTVIVSSYRARMFDTPRGEAR